MAPPRIKEGFASGRYTFQTIWRVEAPMDWAASTTPASTSFREVSTIRAMKGAADTTRGTMAPLTPMVVPTTLSPTSKAARSWKPLLANLKFSIRARPRLPAPSTTTV